jgi:hypothetical protein
MVRFEIFHVMPGVGGWRALRLNMEDVCGMVEEIFSLEGT